MEPSSHQMRKRTIPSLQELADLAGVPLEIVRDIQLDVQEVSAEHVDRINRILLSEGESAEVDTPAHGQDVTVFPKKRMIAVKKKNKLKLPPLPWKHTARGKNASLEIADKFGEPIFDSSHAYDEEIKTTKFIVHAANAIFALAKTDGKDPLEVAIALEMRARNVTREAVLKHTDPPKGWEHIQWSVVPKKRNRNKNGLKDEMAQKKERRTSVTPKCPHEAFEETGKLRCFDPHFKEYLTPQQEWLQQWCLNDFRNCPIFLGLDSCPPKKMNPEEFNVSTTNTCSKM